METMARIALLPALMLWGWLFYRFLVTELARNNLPAVLVKAIALSVGGTLGGALLIGAATGFRT